MPSPYEILEVAPNATDEEIRQSYRRLARQYHPDVCTDEDATERFQTINAAYEQLSDPHRRAEYDNPRPRVQHTTIVRFQTVIIISVEESLNGFERMVNGQPVQFPHGLRHGMRVENGTNVTYVIQMHNDDGRFMFARDGSVHMRATVPWNYMIVGGEVPIPYIDGTMGTMCVPALSQIGDWVTVTGQGLYTAINGTERADLIVEMLPEMPVEPLDDEVLAAIASMMQIDFDEELEDTI